MRVSLRIRKCHDVSALELGPSRCTFMVAGGESQVYSYSRMQAILEESELHVNDVVTCRTETAQLL